MMTGYEQNKRWRKKHPELWQESKARYYKKSQKNAVNARQRWTISDIDMIRAKVYPDSKIAIMIGRSVKAIQVKRTRLKLKK